MRVRSRPACGERTSGAAARAAAGALICLAACVAAGGQTSPSQLAKGWLSNALADDERVIAVMSAFRAVGDEELIPLLAALSRSGDKRRRLAATAALGRVGKPKCIPPLIERLHREPVMAIRAEALAHLVKIEALSVPQLQQAMTIADENVQCIAARALARQGKGQLAYQVLRRLSGSKDPGTAALSRMSLLGLGDSAQMAPLRKLLSDPKTPKSLCGMLMEQIVSENVQWAQPLAVQVAESASGPLKLMAYKAIAKLNPHAAPVLRDAIRSARGLVLKIHLLHVLAECKRSRAHLQALAAEKGSVGALAAFELARPKGGAECVAAARRALAFGHPVVAEYLLNRARKDTEADKTAARLYVPLLMQIVRSVNPNPRTMGKEHIRAAQAVTLLAELNDASALAELKKLLSGRHSAVVMTVAAGLRWSKNSAVCDMMVPLLNNAYEDVVIDAAMTLGYFGRAEATGPLVAIVRNDTRHRKELVALACWYLLKIAQQQKAVVSELVRQVK